MSISAREFLAEAILTREMVDRFLDPDVPNWAIFDAELGYVLRDSVIRDGMDGCYTVSHYTASGERKMLNFAGQPCRVNAYGNSFTQCHQVSDGETWEEYLAAHLGEPIRNLGIGGHGVYQAFRRMLRHEKRQPAEYLILNVWSDDHFRNIYTWRWLHVVEFRRGFAETFSAQGAYMFHCNPWAHMRLNLETGQFEEHPNPYPTPESLYQLCDEEHVYESFKDDFDVQALLALHRVTDTDTAILKRAADAMGLPVDLSSPEAVAKTAKTLLWTCAVRSSMYVVEHAQAFARRERKKLLILLSYSSLDVVNACHGRPRCDQIFADYLRERGIPFVDVLQKHVEDFEWFGCTPEEYIQRYYISLMGHQHYGHYSPTGNHFFAFAIKDDLVRWLDPTPPAYRPGGPCLTCLASTLA
jgi:hypothetical protein